MPPHPAASPAKKANTKLIAIRKSILSIKGNEQKAPKETPVPIMLITHILIFPNLLVRGIHKGTERLEGTKYVKITRTARWGAPTTYCIT